MLKTVLASIFSEKKHLSYQEAVRDELLTMNKRAQEISGEFERKIAATKEALVHLVGEYSIAMTELREHYKLIEKLTEAMDEALLRGNDEVARLKLMEKIAVERKVEVCAESVDMLIPKIKKLYSMKVALSSAQSESLHKTGIMEARARSSEAIGRAQDIMGANNIEDVDLGLSSLTKSMDKLDAFQKAIEEVRVGDGDQEEFSIHDNYEEILKKRREDLGLK